MPDQKTLGDIWAPIPPEEKCLTCRKRRRMEGGKQCQRCFTASRAKEGFCRVCRKRPQVDGENVCAACLKTLQKMGHHCHNCGKNIGRGSKRCLACHEETIEEARSVPREWKVRANNSIVGLRHRAKVNDRYPVAKATEVAELFKEQHFLCALSGIQLKPDNTSVLAHKVAASNGGAFTVDNLFWITKDLNRIMGQMDLDDFSALCRAIADRWPGHKS